jgi:hypothetical protein
MPRFSKMSGKRHSSNSQIKNITQHKKNIKRRKTVVEACVLING